jgi:MFS family permease
MPKMPRLKENSEPIISVIRQDRKWIGFFAAAFSLTVVYAASAAPIPLYTTYRQALHLTNGDLSMTAFAYFAGCVIALLIFARVSNYSGRRPVALVTLGLAAIGCLVFLYLQNDSMFLVGRFIQGISCGLASSTISAYVVDTAPENPRWLGAAVTSGAVMIGLSVGVFGSGALKEIGPGSLTLIYGILIGLIAVCGLLIAAGPETMKPAPGMAASLVPQIRVPGNIRPLLLPASCTFIGVWAIGGFYQAFSSSMASDLLGTTNTIVAATVFASMMAPNAIGGALSGRFRPDVAQRFGMEVFFLCIFAILISLNYGATVPFLVASVGAALAGGFAFTGSMRALLDKTSQEERAGVLSTIFLISYSGAGLPNLIVGRLSGSFGLFEIAIGYSVLVGVTCIITLLTARPDFDHIVAGE